jgi:hypothetical protein
MNSDVFCTKDQDSQPIFGLALKTIGSYIWDACIQGLCNDTPVSGIGASVFFRSPDRHRKLEQINLLVRFKELRGLVSRVFFLCKGF